jgi:hypothetical protein
LRPAPGFAAYAAILAVLAAVWCVPAGNIAQAIVTGVCCAAIALLVALAAARRPAAPGPRVPLGQLWWAYLTACERALVVAGLAAASAGFWVVLLS